MVNEFFKDIEKKLDVIELKIDKVYEENRYLRNIVEEMYERRVQQLKDGKLGNKRS